MSTDGWTIESVHVVVFYARRMTTIVHFKRFEMLVQRMMSIVGHEPLNGSCLKLKVRNVLQKMKSTNASVDIPRPNRLLLKSPCHTGRIRHLLQLYPNAQFVFVHRHPIDVFLSSVHSTNTTYGYMFLQRPR